MICLDLGALTATQTGWYWSNGRKLDMEDSMELTALLVKSAPIALSR